MSEINLSDKTIRKICERLAPMVAEILKEDAPLLTCKEKAEQLGISEGTLRQWVHLGKIDAYKDGYCKQSRLRFRK